MSKTSTVQRIEALKGWMQQMEREGKFHRKARKETSREDDDSERLSYEVRRHA